MTTPQREEAVRMLRLARRDWVLIVSGGIVAMGLTMLAQRLTG